MVVEIAQEVLSVRLVTFENVGAWPCVPSIPQVRLVMLPYHGTRASVFDVWRSGGGHHISSMGYRFFLWGCPAQKNSILVVHEVWSGALHP